MCKAFPVVLRIAESHDSEAEEPAHRPLQFEVAGVTCLGWTAAGAQLRDTHQSELAHAVWMEERVARAEAGLEDVGFIECAPRYPAEQRLGKDISDCAIGNAGSGDQLAVVAPTSGQFAVFVRTGPEYFGHPSCRHRLLGAMINNSTTIWTGPEKEKVAEDFQDAFWRSPRVQGSILLCDSSENRWEYYRSLAGAHGKLMSVDDLKALPSWELMTYLGPPGMAQRHQEWRSWMFANHWSQEGKEDFMVDLDHHPATKGCGGGTEFPTQLCHGTIAALSATSWSLATPSERFCALGFHALPAVCTRWPECDLMRILRDENITRTSLHKLTGNAMNLVSQAAWMMYVLSHCARRDWFESSPRTLPKPSCLEESSGAEGDDERERVSSSTRKTRTSLISSRSLWQRSALKLFHRRPTASTPIACQRLLLIFAHQIQRLTTRLLRLFAIQRARWWKSCSHLGVNKAACKRGVHC